MGDEGVSTDQDFALGAEDFLQRATTSHCLRLYFKHNGAAGQQTSGDLTHRTDQTRLLFRLLLPRPLTPEDLEEIERRMREIVRRTLVCANGTTKSADFCSRNQNSNQLINGIPGDTVSTRDRRHRSVRRPAGGAPASEHFK